MSLCLVLCWTARKRLKCEEITSNVTIHLTIVLSYFLLPLQMAHIFIPFLLLAVMCSMVSATTQMYVRIYYTDVACTQAGSISWLLNNTCAQMGPSSYEKFQAVGNTYQYATWFPSSTQCATTPGWQTITMGACNLQNRFAGYSASQVIIRTEYSDSTCTTMTGSIYYPLGACTIQTIGTHIHSFSYDASDANTIRFNSYANPNCTSPLPAETFSTGSSSCMLDPVTNIHVIYTFTTPLPFSSTGSSGGCCASSTASSGGGGGGGTSFSSSSSSSGDFGSSGSVDTLSCEQRAARNETCAGMPSALVFGGMVVPLVLASSLALTARLFF